MSQETKNEVFSELEGSPREFVNEMVGNVLDQAIILVDDLLVDETAFTSNREPLENLSDDSASELKRGEGDSNEDTQTLVNPKDIPKEKSDMLLDDEPVGDDTTKEPPPNSTSAERRHSNNSKNIEGVPEDIQMQESDFRTEFQAERDLSTPKSRSDYNEVFPKCSIENGNNMNEPSPLKDESQNPLEQKPLTPSWVLRLDEEEAGSIATPAAEFAQASP